jgi:hypothetical protein
MGRVTMATAAGCLGLHIVVLAMTGTEMLAMTAPMLTLSALCLLCAARVRRGAGDHVEHLMMALSALAMVGLHLFMGHEGPVGSLMRAAVVFAGAQALLAVLLLWTGHRNGSCGMSPAEPDDASTPAARP